MGRLDLPFTYVDLGRKFYLEDWLIGSAINPWWDNTKATTVFD